MYNIHKKTYTTDQNHANNVGSHNNLKLNKSLESFK